MQVRIARIVNAIPRRRVDRKRQPRWVEDMNPQQVAMILQAARDANIR